MAACPTLDFSTALFAVARGNAEPRGTILYRPIGGGKWPAEGWIAQSLARDQSDDDVDDVDDGDEDVGDAGYLSVFRLAVCPNVAAPSRELEFGH